MWNIVPKLRKYSTQLMAYQQSLKYLSVPMKWVETEVLAHRLNFLHNPVIRWMFRNVVPYVDPNLNIRPDKARSRNKIDGVSALIDAVGSWLTKEGDKKPAYHEHGLRTIRL
jgi:phage terminase large subunit-like protein